MDGKDLKQVLNRRIRLFLKGGDLYTGVIIFLGDTHFRIKDKYGELIIIDYSEVARIILLGVAK